MTTSPLVARRLLIIEDEIMVAMDMERTLATAGYLIVGVASTVAAALRILKESPIDLAVLDVNLGGESVLPLAERLRADKIPFLFLSGYARDHVLRGEFQELPCLEKPCSDRVLLTALKKLLP